MMNLMNFASCTACSVYFILVLLQQKQTNKEDPKDWNVSYLQTLDILQAITVAVRDLTFCTCHWVFAFRYWSISRQLPVLLATKREETAPQAEKSKDWNKCICWTGIAINVIVPILYCTAMCYFNYIELKRLEETGILEND